MRFSDGGFGEAANSWELEGGVSMRFGLGAERKLNHSILRLHMLTHRNAMR